MKNIIEIRDLVKKYKKAKKNAIDGVSFDVNEGEFFTLLGPNGAGKTTTISVLNTTLSKTGGSVKIGGLEIDKNQDRVRRQIGVIFQNQSLDLNLTAEENVRFHAVLYGMYPYRPTFAMMPEAYRQKVQELSDILGIGEDIHAPIRTFSGGMKRKLEIVKGLIHKPKILFLDEPTTGLDPLSRKNLWQYLEQVRKSEGITLFLTTHYLEEAEDSDRICIINHGKVVSYGTPSEIKKDLVDEYLSFRSSDKESVRHELKSLKLNFTETAGKFKVKVKNDKVQKIMGKIKSELTDIKLHTPTLEGAYLEIISRDHKDE